VKSETTRTRITEAIGDLFDELTGGQKLLVAGVLIAVLSAVCLGGYAWSGWRISRLERHAADARARADSFEKAARVKELEAAQYKQKIEHLEGRLVEIKEIAKTQDEELEKLASSVRDARGDVDRARSIRSIAVTADELCYK
jgi:uncharacterized protein HemX